LNCDVALELISTRLTAIGRLRPHCWWNHFEINEIVARMSRWPLIQRPLIDPGRDLQCGDVRRFATACHDRRYLNTLNSSIG